MLGQIEDGINLCYNRQMRSFQSERIPRPEIDPQVRELLDLGEIDLEIGAGQGLHAIQYCRTQPQRRLVAIERTHARFAGLEQRLRNHPEIKNLSAVHADAVSILTHYVKNESVARLFLLYPNPYPKAKQANQRWHNMPFMSEILSKLKFGGELTLATNSEPYALEAREKMTTTWNMQLIEETTLTSSQTPRTHFEKKYLERGECCWNFVFRKN